MALQEGTYTWEYGNTNQALWFTASYNTVTNQWTVDMKNGSMDLNALWWSNGDSNADGAIKLLSKDNSLNMNGTGIVWDGYDKISDTGLTGTEHNGSSLLTAGNTYTYSYSKDQGVEIEALLAGGVVTLGVRATSVNGTDGIKAVDGQFVFVPYDNTPPTVTVDIVDASLNDGTNSSLVTFEFSEDVTGFADGDVSVSGGTLSDFTQVDGNSYTAIFTADDGVETIGSVSVAADSYSDAAGNNGGAGSDTVTIDTKNPTLAVDIVDASLNDGTNSSLVTFEFSEDVTGFADSDVNISGGTLSDFTQVDGNSYTAIFTADDGVETIGSVSVAADSYSDLVGNNGGAGTDTVTIDTLNPTVGITFDNSPLTGQNFSTTVTFQFSEAVSFTASNVTLANGVLSNFTGSGSSYTAAFTATDFQSPTGTVAVSNDYFDILGNQGVANSANIALTVGGGPDPNDGPSGGDSVIGSGTLGADFITGSNGNDNLSGIDGNDTINGGDGNDTINGGTGADIISGGTGNDNIIGLGGFDLIYGGSGNDTINGGNGIDTIVGGFGNDSLTGGGGDTFRFLSIYDQQDVITGFNDTIVFDITGASAFTALGSGALGTTTYTGAIAGGYLTYSGGVLSYDADGSAGSTFSPLAIVTLTGTLTPTLSDTKVLFQAL
ncbi:Similar to tr/Q8E9G6/Q8E9G6 [Microcystis aeruginosa PCC 9807]|jgi:predicted nucleic-acid-binding Zn-ribbon protein|uniref:Similar to tr/Q8E9G6/Q8E9G6 n=1 Tax=Microcystis aeruginosa PCC 9807 TaxID=1160283 RepID=I4H0W8_MICAE|nr:MULTISPECIES: Ig-like domain-containing protein [Microcystis]MBE5229482.1 calcium-binding protein [Microcystis aeruginosa PMC 728.11]MCZ8223738.1 Ig-like domain-containing protein [Microcystis sp. LE19-84.1B]NCS31652.1 calcium-binding protein [Microcystis aeruginosa F13-15]CCI15692.1 Similar to tr/Q8E9G6/Q8E9G6 [Microcystis aeruginosa PCC 9807]